MFDSSNYIFKLIDPRGRLDSEATIYGDPRYDIAKLRHSVVGLYDFIVQGLFKLTETDSEFEYKILTTKDYRVLEDILTSVLLRMDSMCKRLNLLRGYCFCQWFLCIRIIWQTESFLFKSNWIVEWYCKNNK